MSLFLNVLDIDLPARSHNVNQQANIANTPPYGQCKVLPYFINCKKSVRINVPLFYVPPKRKHTHCLLSYEMRLTVRNILIMEMLKEKVGIRKMFTHETCSLEQHEPACCPFAKLWCWHCLLPFPLTCAFSIVKSSQPLL